MIRLALACLLVLAGCSHKPRASRWQETDTAPEAADAYGEAQAAGGYGASEASATSLAPAMETQDQDNMAAGRGIFSPSPKSAGFLKAKSGGSASSAPAYPIRFAPQQAYLQPALAKRMVHYSGSATLRSTEPERVLDSAIALVSASGGYLENRAGGYAALRVPAAGFDSMFARLLRLAEVIDYRQDAEDITEAVQDNELRLKVVAATLDRLEDLIKKARTESQKLRLLKELKRFREEKEVLEAQKRDLVQRARFASIQLRVRTYTPTASAGIFSRDLADFRWIHGLNPFDDRRFRGRSRLRFPAPNGMVITGKRDPWRATSSQGSEFWGSRIDVDLQGDSRFWREAVRSRMVPGFKASDTAQAGGYLFCHFQSFGPTPYYYWVGVRSRDDGLDVAEFYFPTEAEQAKLLPGLLAAVEGKP
jgi:hypothetical protein